MKILNHSMSEALKNNPDLAARNPAIFLEQESKYRNQPMIYNGIRYHSKKEAEYAQSLDLLQRTGDLKWWTRQVPFYLPSGIKLVVDFGLCRKDGTFHLVEVKGMETQLWRVKMKLLKHFYPLAEVEVIH